MKFAPPAVLRDGNFRIYALGNLISYIGTWAQRVAIGWLSWELTHQTFWVGLISLAQILPLIAFGPLSGALLDRHNHRYFAMTVNSAMAALALLLYALTAAHLMHISVLLIIAFLLGVANSGYQAVRLTMIHEVVAPTLLAQAIAANSVIFNLSRAVGPAIGGIVIARYGLAAAFAVNAVSFLGILAALAAVQLRTREVNKPTQGLLAESRDGWRYVLGHLGIRQMMLMSAVTSTLARGVIELLPAFADSVFHRGSLGLANLTTAVGAGAIVGALVLAWAGATNLLPRVTRLAAIWLGPLVIAFGLCSEFFLGLLISTALGFAIVLCSVGLQVQLQSLIRDNFRGRVLGLWTAVNIAGPGVGGALLGALAQWATLLTVTVAAGSLCVALVVWLTLRSDRLPPALST
ncbi:MAG: MFS transporter [Gammaproteobacteria bacterium]